MVEDVWVVNFCTFRVASLVRTNLFGAAVSLLTEAFVWPLWWRWLPILVVIPQEDGSGIPFTAPVYLSPAITLLTHTEAKRAARVGWAGAEAFVTSGPSRQSELYHNEEEKQFGIHSWVDSQKNIFWGFYFRTIAGVIFLTHPPY